MSQDLIRLRVSVQRHGVPEVKLVWPCPRSHDLTVSKFLSLVNEVMPLESGEWGLEDYVVELTDGAGESYECLHFQPVPQILKNDDHVLIRCLHGEDLKRRRLSGRHQISADGRHLVDGLVFGRPWLRTPRDRPALELPPRKRARTARDYGSNHDFEDEDGHQLPEAPQPRLLPERAQQDTSSQDLFAEGSDDSDEYLDQDLDEDMDQEMDDACLDELAEELKYLRDDNLAVGHDAPTANPGNASPNRQVQGAPAPSPGGLDLRALDGIVALREAFPRMPAVAIEVELLRQQKDLRKAYDALCGSHEPTLCFEEMMEKVVIRLLVAGEAPPWGNPDDNAMRQRSSTARPMIQVVESINVSGDAAAATPSPVLQQATSSSTTDEGTNGDTDNTEYTAEDIDTSDGTSSDDADSSGELASSSDDDDGGSDDDDGGSDDSGSDSDSESDSSDDDLGAPVGRGSSDDEESSSGFSSDSSGSDGSESDSYSSDDGTGASTGGQAAQNTPQAAQIAPQAAQITPHEGGHGHVEASNVPSGAPPRRTKTQKRNARRRRSLARIQADQSQDSDAKREEARAALEVRKLQLLRAVGERAGLAENSQNAQAAQDDGDGDAGQKDGDAPSTEPVRQRLRVDLGAGRRLVFGSLGLKAPKTQADEEKIKQRLMKDVRPLLNMRLTEGDNAGDGPSVAAGRDIENWRQMVTYRGVECSSQGIVLTEPPFPFEQRWDPQQRGGAGQKRKRTSQEFFDDYEGDDDSGLYMEEDMGRRKRIKSLTSDPFGLDVTGDKKAPGKALSSETGDKKAPGKRLSSETEGRSTKTAQADDVPPLPADLGSLADMEAGGAKEGMVITWKQIAMSKATRWQPTVVQQTGTVLAGSNEREVYVALAMRDRQDRSKRYDEDGKRIYDKFEMPEADSDDGEDNGERTVSWVEMMEPKIVRGPDEKMDGI